jgi:hypothetical protein
MMMIMMMMMMFLEPENANSARDQRPQVHKNDDDDGTHSWGLLNHIQMIHSYDPKPSLTEKTPCRLKRGWLAHISGFFLWGRAPSQIIMATDGELNWAGEEECEDPRPSTPPIWQAWQTHNPWFFFLADGINLWNRWILKAKHPHKEKETGTPGS